MDFDPEGLLRALATVVTSRQICLHFWPKWSKMSPFWIPTGCKMLHFQSKMTTNVELCRLAPSHLAMRGALPETPHGAFRPPFWVKNDQKRVLQFLVKNWPPLFWPKMTKNGPPLFGQKMTKKWTKKWPFWSKTQKRIQKTHVWAHLGGPPQPDFVGPCSTRPSPQNLVSRFLYS